MFFYFWGLRYLFPNLDWHIAKIAIYYSQNVPLSFQRRVKDSKANETDTHTQRAQVVGDQAELSL